MFLKPDENVLQHELARFQMETAAQNLVTNNNKTFIMLFNCSRNYAFPPEFTLGQQELAIKTHHKILGVMVQDDARWGSQVEHMTKKASSKIWLLRRMRKLGVDELTIAAFWKAEGLCHLEYCSPVWSGALTKQQERDLARVHRRAVAAITGSNTRGEEFVVNCRRLGLDHDLAARRLRLALKFAKRTAENSRHMDLFEPLDNPPVTRRGGKLYREPPCRTRRHLQSARPYLTRLLNGETR